MATHRPSASSKQKALALSRIHTPRDTYPAIAYPPIGYPGIGVMSTQAAPARNSPEATGSSGAGSLPDIPAHPAKMERARIDATDTVIENFMMLLIRKESPG